QEYSVVSPIASVTKYFESPHVPAIFRTSALIASTVAFGSFDGRTSVNVGTTRPSTSSIPVTIAIPSLRPGRTLVVSPPSSSAVSASCTFSATKSLMPGGGGGNVARSQSIRSLPPVLVMITPDVPGGAHDRAASGGAVSCTASAWSSVA